MKTYFVKYNKRADGTIGNMMLVGIAKGRDLGYQFGWCRATEEDKKAEYAKGAEVPDFQPVAAKPIIDPETKQPIVAKNNEPIMQWVF
jgi:hypothetical protein